jgi:hypothetical protein
MSIIPLHIQRRFEQRWAARFVSLVIPAVPKSVGLKDSLVNIARRTAKAKKTRRDGSVGQLVSRV